MTTLDLPSIGGDTDAWGVKLNDILSDLNTQVVGLQTAVAEKASAADVSHAYVARDSAHDVTDATQLAKFATYSTQVAVAGNINAIVGQAINDLPASTTSFPAGITGFSRVNNAGNQGFGVYGRAELYAAGVATNEFNSFNYTTAPSGTYPPNRAIGTTDRLPICLTVASGGTQPSAVGIHIVPEGSAPQKFLTGIYVEPTAIRDYPMLIEGGVAAYPSVIAGSGTWRSASNVAAAFGVTGTDGATGANVLLGALTGTAPFIGASLTQGVATALHIQTNNTDRLVIGASGDDTLTGTLTIVPLSAAGVPLSLQQFASQASALLRVRDATNSTTIASIGNNGQFRPGNGTTIGGGLWSGSGAPTFSATSGDYYFRTDTPATTNQRVYVCTGGTSWTAIL